MTQPGVLMAAEIIEQPDAWRRLLTEGREQVDTVARRIAEFDPGMVLFVARGTSDHAALYGKYLTEIVAQRPAGLVSPSTMTAYGARPSLDRVLMVGVSQSGGSPDLVQSLEVARRQGALTLVIDRLRGGDGSSVEALPALAEQVIAHDSRVHELAQRYRFASRLVTTARGYSYATAREAALKLMETSYVGAQAFSGADLLHGPLAMIDPQVPVLTVVAPGVGGTAMQQVLPRLAEVGADVFCVGSPAAVDAASVGVALPAGVSEELSPLLEIIPFQQLALHLAVARGGDPDAPRGLKKITETL
jgi:glutamine---fructose-6-phosphate transaminase (isomerizing)